MKIAVQAAIYRTVSYCRMEVPGEGSVSNVRNKLSSFIPFMI
jgi:hypothetical protein